jgi:hypothetical protein
MTPDFAALPLISAIRNSQSPDFTILPTNSTPEQLTGSTLL